MRKNDFIPVTQPHMPPLEEFIQFLQDIWESKYLTNSGPFHQQLEVALADYLRVEHLSLFTNATIALIVSLQALQITGEVITTPYSFVATAHSLLWSNVKPIFVDIDRDSLNIDPDLIEKAITPATKAIMAVHCYGRPCAIDKIQKIAEKHQLKVIYDAAHAFGVRYKNESILNFGDLSILSFHATKVFNTFEGGAIISPDLKTKQHIDHLKNFGFLNETTVVGCGINGKMNEVQAAFGLLQLKYIDSAISARAKIDHIYRDAFAKIKGILLFAPSQNYSYFPILVTKDYPLSRDELYVYFRENNIGVRRYFYPLITEMLPYKNLSSQKLPVAESIAEQILCLPIYPDLSRNDQDKIIHFIREKSNVLLHAE